MQTGKIRVCHVITRLDVGGAAENTLRTVCGLDASRYEVSLISGRTDHPLSEWIDRAEAQGVRLYVIPELLREIHLWDDLRVLFKLHRLFRQIRPELVHTHSSKSGLLGRLAARLARVPHVIHTPHGHVFQGYGGSVITHLFRLLEKWAARMTEKIITLTDLEIKQHLDAGIGKRSQYVTIPSGVEIERFQKVPENREALRKELRVPSGAFCIGAAGRLVAVKNFSLLIEALGILHAKHPDHYHLVILGEGAERGQLYHRSLEEGVQDHVYLPGWVSDMERYYSAFDVFALSSNNEGMGRVLVEAMAAGVPIVATAVGGVPELLQDGACGILTPPGDAQALADAIESLTADATHSKELVEKAKLRAQSYTAVVMLEKIDHLYEEILSNRGKSS